jgi:hypothetical protein
VSLQRAHSAIPAGCAVRRRTRPGAHEAAETKGRDSDSGQPPRRMLRRRSPGSHPAASMQPHAAARRHTRRRLPLPSLCRPVRTGLSLRVRAPRNPTDPFRRRRLPFLAPISPRHFLAPDPRRQAGTEAADSASRPGLRPGPGRGTRRGGRAAE